MKNILTAVAAIIGMVGLNAAFAAGEMMHHEGHQHKMSMMMDTRISLGMPEEMKQHQLSNMREHLDAINSITGLMAENKFAEASKIAYSKLGLTPEMQKMCSMFNNEKFMEMGMAFHKSGDALGDALKTKNMNASLRALNQTLQYCVQCHAAYRQ
ncbi:MAG: cytochrome C [Gallionella sp.]|nr:cytochrome C [Gallionella sp.]